MFQVVKNPIQIGTWTKEITMACVIKKSSGSTSGTVGLKRCHQDSVAVSWLQFCSKNDYLLSPPIQSPAMVIFTWSPRIKTAFPASFAAKCDHVTKLWPMRCKRKGCGQMLGPALKGVVLPSPSSASRCVEWILWGRMGHTL